MQEIIMRMMNDEFTGLTPKKKKNNLQDSKISYNYYNKTTCVREPIGDG